MEHGFGVAGELAEGQSRPIGSPKDAKHKAIIDRKEKTGKLPKAIVPVALYGMPYDCEKILVIADKYGIPVVEANEAFIGC